VVPGSASEEGSPDVVPSLGTPERAIATVSGAPAEPVARLVVTWSEATPPRRTVWSDGVKLTVNSNTFTWNDPVAVLPCASPLEQVTVVVPSRNVEPEEGEQVTGSEPSTASVAVAE